MALYVLAFIAIAGGCGGLLGGAWLAEAAGGAAAAGWVGPATARLMARPPPGCRPPPG